MALDLGQGFFVQELLLTQSWLELFEARAASEACKARWEALASLYANACPTDQPLLRCWHQLRRAVWGTPLRAVVEEIEAASPEFAIGQELSRALAGCVQHLGPNARVALLRALGKARGALVAWTAALMRLSEAPIQQEREARDSWNSVIYILFLGGSDDSAEEEELTVDVDEDVYELTVDVDEDVYEELQYNFEDGCQLLRAGPELPVCAVPAPERVAMVAGGRFREMCSLAAEQASAKEGEQIMHGLRAVKAAATEVAWGRQVSAAEYGWAVEEVEALLKGILAGWETRVPSSEEEESSENSP